MEEIEVFQELKRDQYDWSRESRWVTKLDDIEHCRTRQSLEASQ